MTPHLSISRYLPTLTCIQYSYCRPYSDCRPFPKTYTMRFSCITVMHVMITCIRSNFLWAPGDYWQWHAIAFRCFAYPHCKSMHFTHCEHCIQYKFLIYPPYHPLSRRRVIASLLITFICKLYRMSCFDDRISHIRYNWYNLKCRHWTERFQLHFTPKIIKKLQKMSIWPINQFVSLNNKLWLNRNPLRNLALG